MNLRHLFPLQLAFAWACKQRADYSHNADIWTIRYHWDRIQKTLPSVLNSGRYLFSPLKQMRFADGSIKDIWSALDAIVLKTVAIWLTPLMSRLFSGPLCHLKGQGGSKRALREVMYHLPKYQYVMRSDVKGYYASMCHQTLYDQVRRVVKDGRILALIWQFMKRTVEYGGIFWTVQRGISLGCPLSPLMAALYLRPLDEAMAKLDVFYIRYMDDWIILAKTRWQLKRAVKIVNQVLNDLKVEKHPDKTFIGPIKKGFCFLGYQFDKRGLRVSPQTKQRAVVNAKRLYEQCGTKDPVVAYFRRFNTWARSGLCGCLVDEVPFDELVFQLCVETWSGSSRSTCIESQYKTTKKNRNLGPPWSGGT